MKLYESETIGGMLVARARKRPHIWLQKDWVMRGEHRWLVAMPNNYWSFNNRREAYNFAKRLYNSYTWSI